MIGKVEILPALTSSDVDSSLFSAGNCKDSDLTTSCRLSAASNAEELPNAIAVGLVADFEINVKSVTIYTPQTDVDGYDPGVHDIEVDDKLFTIRKLLFGRLFPPKGYPPPLQIFFANFVLQNFGVPPIYQLHPQRLKIVFCIR